MNSPKPIKTLMIATSQHTRGGITTVLNTYRNSPFWAQFHCRWIETHRDRNFIVKLLYFIKSFLQALFLIPCYDIVHIHTSRPASVIRKLPFALYAHLWGKKVITHLHFFETDVVFDKKNRGLYRTICSVSEKIIVLSERAKREFSSDIIPLEKMQVIYNPITATPDNTTQYKTQNYILFAGLLTPLKGYRDLIEAFASIAPRHPEWKVILAGSGEIENARNIARQAGIESQVELPGWVSGEDKDKLFAQAGIFCLPSYAEGFPMAVLDAWAYRLAVVTTPVGGLPDVLVEQENALTYTPGDIPALAQQLERLITDTSLREKIASNAHKLARTKFDMTTISSEIERLYINTIR